MGQKNIALKFIVQFARTLPPSLLELLLNSEGKVNRFARLGLIKRLDNIQKLLSILNK